MEDVIIFGRGNYYQQKSKELRKKYRVIAFLDNAVEMEKGEIDGSGVAVLHPQNIFQLPQVPVLLMSLKWMEMAQQLIGLGIDGHRIVFGSELKPFYDDAERILEEVNARILINEYQIILQYKGNSISISSEDDYKKALALIFRDVDPYIRQIAGMPVIPASRKYGCERGKAVDRYYIEQFLRENQNSIRGDVMEIENNTYTYMFGKEITHAYALHVNGWGKNVVKGNFATGEGIVENSIDCLICTQTIQMIYDIHEAVKNIYKILKPGGVALITASAISEISLYDYRNWGEYWRMTDKAFQKLFEECFDQNNIRIKSYGNVKTAVSILYGLCIEDLKESDFEYCDEEYPVIVTAVVKK